MTPQNVDRLLRIYRDGLLEDTLPFWIDHGVDRLHGGIMTSLDRDGTVIDTDKGVWQQGRFAWLMGELYNRVEPRKQWLELALGGIRFIDEHCFDPSDGRMWFHVTRDGRPIRKRRYAFSESFAAIAYGELAKATGDGRFAEQARATFARFVGHDLEAVGVEPKFTATRPTKSIAIPMITIATAQELRDSIGLAGAEAWIDRGIEAIRRDHVKEDLRCVMETVALDGSVLDHFDGRTLNPGHAIEAAWFVMREGKLRGDRELVDLGCRMLDWMWERGWDPDYGGILYFVDLRDLPVQEYWHDMKFWWPQCEATIANLMAYSMTGKESYLTQFDTVHQYIKGHFIDREFGEWYGYLHRDGSLSTPLKGNMYKGPFHIPRMYLVCCQLLDELRR